MVNEDIAKLVASHPFLSDLPGNTAELVSGCARHVAIGSGLRLLREGEPANSLYLLRRGRVSLELRTPGRGALVVETLGPGAALGLSWLFPPYRWQFDARALEPVGAIEVDAACFRAKMEADPAFGYALVKRLTSIMLQRLQATRRRLLELYSEAGPSAQADLVRSSPGLYRGGAAV
ncbi:MAG: cyclic nucleotide-binding domain-containing protein [Acidimicrobiales bacterium]